MWLRITDSIDKNQLLIEIRRSEESVLTDFLVIVTQKNL